MGKDKPDKQIKANNCKNAEKQQKSGGNDNKRKLDPDTKPSPVSKRTRGSQDAETPSKNGGKPEIKSGNKNQPPKTPTKTSADDAVIPMTEKQLSALLKNAAASGAQIALANNRSEHHVSRNGNNIHDSDSDDCACNKCTSKRAFRDDVYCDTNGEPFPSSVKQTLKSYDKEALKAIKDKKFVQLHALLPAELFMRGVEPEDQAELLNSAEFSVVLKSKSKSMRRPKVTNMSRWNYGFLALRRAVEIFHPAKAADYQLHINGLYETHTFDSIMEYDKATRRAAVLTDAKIAPRGMANEYTPLLVNFNQRNTASMRVGSDPKRGAPAIPRAPRNTPFGVCVNWFDGKPCFIPKGKTHCTFEHKCLNGCTTPHQAAQCPRAGVQVSVADGANGVGRDRREVTLTSKPHAAATRA
jgi:hypothetical protein